MSEAVIPTDFVTGCTGKARFASASKAHETLRRMSRSHRNQRVYRCQYCDGWHMTSQGTKSDPTVHPWARHRP